MSRFSGPQYPGALKDYRKDQRAAAEARLARSREHEEAKRELGIVEGGQAFGKAVSRLADLVFPEPTAAQREGNASRHTRSRRNRRSEG